MNTKQNNRLGEVNKNRYNTSMKIIKYINANCITVKFEDEHGFERRTVYKCFKDGEVSNPYDKTIYGIGYLGVGIYKSHTKVYDIWCKMIKRCYTNETKYPTYKDCTVCDEWLDFQNYAKWYDDNFYKVPNQKMCVDKDILHKSNKIYSPENCIFVPNNINVLFTKRQNCRGKLPIGVYYNKLNKNYRASCEDGDNNTVNLGSFVNPIDAFNVYKIFKENLIKSIANKYKVYIPITLYTALINYCVSIND